MIFISDGFQGEREVTTYRAGKELARLKGQQLQRPRGRASLCLGNSASGTPTPNTHISPTLSFTRTIFSWYISCFSQQGDHVLMEHAQRSFLPALTVSEGSTHGHLIPSFWTHCRAECHGGQAGRQVGMCSRGDFK